MSDEDESEVEDDERIMKVLMFLDKHTPAETAAYLRDELGGQDALVYGLLLAGKPCHARAHFLLMGIPLNEAKPLPEQLEANRVLFKAATQGNEDQAALLVMLELFCVKEKRDALKCFGPILKALWERDIVEQEVIEAWVENERALAEFHPPFFSQEDAEAIRASSGEFIHWLDAGEDE